MIPVAELKKRQERFRLALQQEGIEGALLIHLPSIYYLTGIGIESHLWIDTDGALWLFPRRKTDELREKTEVQILNPLRLSSLQQQVGKHETIGLELDILPVSQYFRIQRSETAKNYVDVSLMLMKQRSQKSSYELKQIERSAKLLDESMDLVYETLREGMTEIELSAKIDTYLRENGHPNVVPVRTVGSRMVTMTNVVSGEALWTLRSTFTAYTGQGRDDYIPLGPSNRKLRKDEPILVDITSYYAGYITDATRTFVIGKLDNELWERVNAAEQILNKMEEWLREGKTAEEVYQEGYNFAAELGVDYELMGRGENRVRFLGHGVGLELDELPVIAPRQNYRLKEGNVIAVEPKLFVKGTAVGREDTFVIEAQPRARRVTQAPNYLVE